MKTDAMKRLTPRALEMRRLIEEQSASGVSVAEFARRRGVTPWKIWYWRQRLGASAAAAATASTMVRVRIIGDDDSREPETAQIKGMAAAFAIATRNGRRIEVAGDFSASDLRRLIEVVESC